MCSRPFRPLGFAHLCRSRPRGSVHSLLPSQLYVDRSHCPRPHASYLAALPSTRAISQTPVFYVAHPIRSIREQVVQRAIPILTKAHQEYVAFLFSTATCVPIATQIAAAFFSGKT